MAIKTWLEKVEEYDAAITASLSAIDVGVSNKRIIRERIASLERARQNAYNQYLAEQNSASGGFINKAQF